MRYTPARAAGAATVTVVTLLVAATGSLLCAAPPAAAQQSPRDVPSLPSPDVVVARRPSVPYRLWYAPKSLAENPATYSGLTIDTGGRAAPRLLESRGATSLDWVYGTQISWDAGPDYWVERASVGKRTKPATAEHPYAFVTAGISVDEWIGSRPEVRRWIVDGLRTAKKANPELFVSVWATGVTAEIATLAREGVIDLIVLEAYNITERRGLGVSWATALERCEAAKKAGLERKTILSLGHITDVPNWKGGEIWTEETLRARMRELKARYPRMPGIAFFTAAIRDPAAYDRIARACDRLSREYWPDDMALEGQYRLTPQNSTRSRLDVGPPETKGEARQAVTFPSGLGADGASQVWRLKPLVGGAYTISSAASPSLSLSPPVVGAGKGGKDVKDARVRLTADPGGDAPGWRLTKVAGGYALSPANAPHLRLDSGRLGDGAQLRLAPAAPDSPHQVWALTPEQ